MENASEGTHSNKIVAASAVKRVLDSRFVPRHSLEDVQVKRNTHRLLLQQSSLITEMWQNISGENLRLLNLKMLSIYGSTFVNAHFLQCRASSNASVRVFCNLQSQLHCAVTPFEQNFTKLVSSRQHQVLLMVSKIIYLFQ